MLKMLFKESNDLFNFFYKNWKKKSMRFKKLDILKMSKNKNIGGKCSKKVSSLEDALKVNFRFSKMTA